MKDNLPERSDSMQDREPYSHASWMITLIILFFSLSGIVGSLLAVSVYPIFCPIEILVERLLAEPKLDDFVIRRTSSANIAYLQDLQQGLQELTDVASIVANPFGFSSVMIQISADPGEFPRAVLPTPASKSYLLVSGPLRDLYDFPLVPPPSDVKDSEAFIHVPWGPVLFSFAGFIRNQAVTRELEERRLMASNLHELLETKRLQTRLAWLVITFLFVFLWMMIQKRPLTQSELIVLIILGVFTYHAIFMTSSRHASFLSHDDTKSILVEHREEIKTQFREYVEKCFIEKRLDVIERDNLLKSLDVPGYLIPKQYNKKYRRSSLRFNYLGVGNFIERNELGSFFPDSCVGDGTGAK
ncbi:MAG: hypothetical protein KKB51_23375 [Candidatus Riflebacteria bacterium]|nr:hypothetical protein [Candidatus Riflebacteria bacterium]